MVRRVLSRVLRRPSHATVVAYLALFMGMSGTAYATVLWTGANIQDGSLTGSDVQDGSLTGSDVAPDSITGAQIAPGSITGTDLAPGTGGSGASSTTVLGTARNPSTVAGPRYSTAPSSHAQTVVSVTFTVPAGVHYQVLTSIQTVFTASDGSCGGQTTYSGDVPDVYLDGDHSHSLVGYLNGYLPDGDAGALGGSQPLVVGEGTHTVALVADPSACTSAPSAGTMSLTDSYLSVNLLGQF